jgi:hypothetical protein
VSSEAPVSRAGCTRYVVAGSVLLAVGAVGAVAAWRSAEKSRAEAREQHAEKVFEPGLAKLTPPGSAARAYDIDATIRVIHGIDRALEHQDSFDAYMQEIARQDYRGVAPEVLESRKALFAILQDLYARQKDLEDQQELWSMTEDLLLATLSVVQVEGNTSVLNPGGSFSVDRAQARRLYDDLQAREEKRLALMSRERELREELFEALVDYADVYYRYVEEWDQLSLLRDRARLAVHNGDWEAAIAASELAIAKAPNDREARLMLAQALVERNEPEDDERIGSLLSEMLAAHPEQSAPVFLLTGVHALRRGDAVAAQLALQQSAAYYPKQAERLTDMLDPYEMRRFLKRSREGNLIVDGYKATMLGAGFWSPDLELARMLFDRGDDAAGRAKVLDHFARRRTQGEWDLILQDIAFCHDLLGPRFWEIFPEESYLDLGVAPTLLRDGLSLTVTNRSDRTLHNATLILCLQFTDMFPGTYVAIPAEATVPAVLAHEETSFGDLELAVDVLGITKGVGDVVEQRAVLVSNEAVSWVDTEAYKIAEADEFRRETKRTAMTDRRSDPSIGGDLLRRAIQSVPRSGRIEVVPKMGSDDVVVRLPSELAIVRPSFRLRTASRDMAPDENAIEGDDIVLRFSGVENFAEGATPRFELRMTTPFGDVALRGGPQAPMTVQLLP